MLKDIFQYFKESPGAAYMTVITLGICWVYSDMREFVAQSLETQKELNQSLIQIQVEMREMRSDIDTLKHRAQ